MQRLLSLSVAAAVFLPALAAAADDKQKADSKPQRVELAADLIAEAPAAWKMRAVERRPRTHEASFPSTQEGLADGTLTVYHFGKGGGGDLESNLSRWYKMMEQPDGSSSEKVAKKAEIPTDAAKIVWIDVPGTYLDRPFPAAPDVTKRPKYRLFAAMINGGKEGPYWIRAVGPDAVMQAQRDAFEKFLKSIAKK